MTLLFSFVLRRFCGWGDSLPVRGEKTRQALCKVSEKAIRIFPQTDGKTQLAGGAA